MGKIIYQKYILFTHRFREAWLACLLCMVQGDLTIISLNHIVTAAKTGTIAGLSFMALSFSKKLEGNIILSTWTIGILTAGSDFLIHPTHFGPELAEALCTGAGAAALGFCMMKWQDKK